MLSTLEFLKVGVTPAFILISEMKFILSVLSSAFSRERRSCITYDAYGGTGAERERRITESRRAWARGKRPTKRLVVIVVGVLPMTFTLG